MMLSYDFYNRQAGKYRLMKVMMAAWCQKAKKGSKFLLASPFGIYELQFNGEFKPKKSDIVFSEIEELNPSSNEGEK